MELNPGHPSAGRSLKPYTTKPAYGEICEALTLSNLLIALALALGPLVTVTPLSLGQASATFFSNGPQDHVRKIPRAAAQTARKHVK